MSKFDYFDPATLAAIRDLAESPALKAAQRMAAEIRLVDFSAVEQARSQALDVAAALQADHKRFQDLTHVWAGSLTSQEKVSILLGDAIEAMSRPLLSESLGRVADLAQVASGQRYLDEMLTVREALAKMEVLPQYDKISQALAALDALPSVQGLAGGIASQIAQLTAGHNSLLEAYGALQLDPVSVGNPLVSEYRLPEIDVALSARTVVAFVDEDVAEEDEPELGLIAEVHEMQLMRIEPIVPHATVRLRSALRQIDSDDPQAWQNASLAVRQAVLGTIAKLSPVAEVRQWALEVKKPELFRDGKLGGTPIRPARIKYLSRYALDDSSKYTEFLERNVEDVLTVLKHTNIGVHDEDADVPRLTLRPASIKRIVMRGIAAVHELVMCWATQPRNRR